jgi:hypothetical protein
MRTTVDVSDELFRRAKAEAALRGRKFKDLVEEGLRLVLESPQGGPPRTESRPALYDLMKGACGIVDSGLTDLASNPKHLQELGRDSLGHR